MEPAGDKFIAIAGTDIGHGPDWTHMVQTRHTGHNARTVLYYCSHGHEMHGSAIFLTVHEVAMREWRLPG